MKYSYIIFICILNVLLNRCSYTTLINETYRDKHSHEFIFSRDSTFKYIYHGIWYKESFGTWEKIGNAIYLNSIEQIDKIPIEYTKIKDNKENIIINIKVNVPDKPQRDYICFPYVNGELIFMYPERGSYSFESDISIDSIYFSIAKRPFVLRGTGSKMSYDDIKTETIYPNLSVGEKLTVTININDPLFGYRVFKNERLDLKNGKIIFKEGNKKYRLSLKK